MPAKRVNIGLGALLLFLVALPVQGQSPAPQDGEAALAEVQARIRNLDTDGLRAALEANPELVLIDVRMPDEINTLGGTIGAPNSFNIPRGWLEFRVADTVPDKDTPVVVFCGINRRSPFAAETLTRMGYTDVRNYADGFFAWRDAGLSVDMTDEALNSMLYSLPREVQPGVWSAIGATAPGTYENSGHNNNLSFIVTDDGVLVVNAGDNYLLARALHEEIKKITDQPVRYVVLENGQGHAMLGSNYWQEQGATVIAHEDAAHEIEELGHEILERMQVRNRDKAMGTVLTMPDETFQDERIIEMGGERIELRNLGPAHSPGDIVVWLPERKLVISGDMAFHERLLPVFENTDTAGWIESWENFAALGAEVVIPGHGGPTNMDEVTRFTRDYLVYMRERVGGVIEEGGDLQAAYAIDQSPYSHLDTFEFLATQNAGRIFRAMEFEW
jgi:glyoxylase-like metal-dependent hydrolase (beta-lactamase superfamily II)/rhodanese-related sulfurtransferase